jgi:pyruvate dehydrogenase E1 component alpha subunit
MHRVSGGRDLAETRGDDDDARAMLRDMVRARRFDERALALQRRGWMSGYPPFRGQEGSQVGAAHAMAAGDWLAPTYRANAMLFARGVPMTDVLRFRRGREEFHSGHEAPVLPEAVPIATQIPHATGVGMAMNYTGADDAVVCYFGDGATSEGDFHEGLNFAGVFEAPVVFFCENNGWAISMPEERQTSSESIAAKAPAYGMEGAQVDGNDPFAVFEAMALSLERARGGEPVLLESLTYRQGGHTTADDPGRYAPEELDLPDWRTADPIERTEAYLAEQGVVDDGFVASAREAADEEVTEAVEAAESIAPAELEEVFDFVFAETPPELVDQREWLRAFVAEHGDVNELAH